jgi:hypothetical protein
VLDVVIRLRDARKLPDITLPPAEAGDAAWAAWRERVHARSTLVMAEEKQRLLALGLIDEHWNPLTNELPEDMLPSSTLPPENAAVRNVKAHPGMVQASCDEELSVVGYAFQIGTDPTHPETWPPQIVSQGHTHKFANLPIGQIVYVRVAVIRRGSIQSPWSPILQITAL